MHSPLPKKDGRGSDLQLFGSQISLSERPHPMSGRASARSTSVCDRRPMSAMPMLENQNASERVGGRRRPLSADNPCLTPGDFMSGYPGGCLSSQMAARFTACTSQLPCTEFGEEFVETLPSVLFLEDLSSESFGHTWIKSELETFRSDDTHTVMSEQCQSEMSLGQKIKAMAQHSKDMRPTNPTTPPEKHPEIIGSTLMPGLALKPPIPHPKPNLSSRGNVSVCNKTNTPSLQDNKEDTHSPSCSHIFQNKYERSYMFQNSDPTMDKIINNVIVEGSEAVGSSFHSPNSNNDDVITDIQELVLQRENEFFILKESNDATNLAIREPPKNGQLDNQKDEQQISEVEKLSDLKFQRWFPDEPIFTLETVSDHNTSRTSLTLNPIENQPLTKFKQIKKSATIDERFTSTNQDVQSWMSLHNIPERDVGVCSSSTTPRNTTSSGSKTNKDNTSSPKIQIKEFLNELAEDKSQHCSSPQGKCETAWGKNQSEDLMTAQLDNSRDPLWDGSCSSNTAANDKMSELGAATMDPAINSTYEDIVNILKYMEQEECCSLLKLTSATDISVNADPAVTSDINQSTSLPSSGKLKDILSYLDEVDQCCTSMLDSAKTNLQAVKDTTQSTQLQLGLVPRLDDLLQMSVVDLSHEVLTLRLQLEERTSSISVLQEALTQQRELTLRNTQNTDKELKGRLKEQKQHLEAIIGRHQKFIDQLIADKKVLSEKCESLVRELKGSEDRHATNMRAIEERHSIELHQAKEMHAAAEKLRRERWIDSKTQKIKEMTVKGLEPELQRMNTRHQQELSELRTLHKQELEEVEMRATRRATVQLEQLTAEREEVLTRERNSLKQRFEKQLCEEESRYQEERRRLLADVQREKDRLSEEMERVRQEGEEAKKNLVRESQRNLERVKSEFKEALDAANRRHQNELKLAKETYDADQEAWMYNYKKHQTAALVEKETELREQLKRERDREIELVIERLETEAVKCRTELEQTADNRLRRLKEKYECEVKELEVLEQQLKNKYSETKSRLMEREDTILSLQANVRQLDKELEEARKIVDRLSVERAEVKEVVRKELSSQLAALEQEVARTREELAESRVRAQLQLAAKEEKLKALAATKETELQEVYRRVKLAVAKKDESVQQLQKQYEAALERCCHLEDLLEQQRRDFLLK